MDEYRTRNLQLAIFILARGAEVPEIRGEAGRAEFVFLDEETNSAGKCRSSLQTRR